MVVGLVVPCPLAQRLPHPLKGTVGLFIPEQSLLGPFLGLLSVALQHGCHGGCILGIHLDIPRVLVAEPQVRP